jgi:hypothetical protein
MSDYLANLAARSMGGMAVVRPRVPGIYEPPGLGASPWFGDIGNRENSIRETADAGKRSDWASTAGDSLHRSDQGRDEAKNRSSLHEEPSRVVLPSSRVRSVSEVPPIPDSSESSPSRKEALGPDVEKEVVSAERVPPFSPNTFDVVTFFQGNQEESREPQIASRGVPNKPALVQKPADSFGKTRSAETEDAIGPRAVRGQMRPVPGTVEDVSTNEPGTSSRDLLELARPREPHVEDAARVVAPATIRKETPSAESFPIARESVSPRVVISEAGSAASGVVAPTTIRKETPPAESFPIARESVSPRAHPVPKQGVVISEAGSAASGFEIPKIAARESPTPRLQAIWREPRPPITLLHRTENVAQPGHRQAEGQLSNASNPTVQVTIGRIEVRASTPQVSNSTRERAMPGVMGLKEYLGQRAGRRGK